jgi:EAL domain-containing protein (putative c-di-GMP-specific phosphodiesterase class I)
MAKVAADSGAEHSGRDVAADLARALENDEFFLVYQPTIDLHTNAFAGVEALIRWRHPSRGVVSPHLFIDELEASGEIVPVGRWALNVACAQGAAWHDRGYRFTVSVNVSPKQFESDQFVGDVADALSSSRFDAALLVLEFSQATILRGKEPALPRLKQLRTLGVRFAVDDFVPGRSTLDDLQEFDIDIVKLDRAFIAGISSSLGEAALVHELVQLSKTRHLQIIASGIESAEQRKQLQIEEVNTGQGYLFSVPHEAEEIDRFLEDFAIFSGKPL